MRILITLFTLFMAHTLSATNYYVSTAGADSNTGTKDAPFLTIGKASSMLLAGDTCFIMAGTYREVLQPQNNGTAGKPIVYTNYNKEEVVISATETVNTWQKHDGNIYKAAFTMALGRQNMVFCDDKAMDWARWPNNEDNDIYTIDAVSVNSGSGSTVVADNLPTYDWKDGYIWYLGAHSGTSWTRKITSNTSTNVTFEEVDINKWPFDPHNPTVFRNGNRGRFYLMGVLEALDYEREWFYKDGVVYFQAPGNVDPSSLKVEIGQREKTINLNKSYIHIDGINVFGGKVDISSEYCELRNSKIINGLQILDELDNTDAQVGDAPVLVRASNTTISHNTIDGSSLNGIFVQGWGGKRDIDINNNYIQNCNTVGIHSSPIRSSAPFTRIYGNTIKTTGRDGMYNGGTDCEIAYNDVSDCMRINNDGGVFYTVGNANDKNTVIHHNWFHDSKGPEYADGRAAGIYLDNHSKGYVVHHNVVWDVTWTGIQINWDNWNIDIYNNTIYKIDSAMGRWEKGYTIDDIVLKNNYASIGEFIGTDISKTSNLINKANPFVSLETHDFRPTKTSLLTDKGEEIAGITDNFTGTAPDIGAYEYLLTPWRPGVNPEMGGVKEEEPVDPEEPVTSITDDVFKTVLKVYPNPLNGAFLTIDAAMASDIQIYDGTGRMIYQNTQKLLQHRISKTTFPTSGIYLIKVQIEGKTLHEKVLIK